MLDRWNTHDIEGYVEVYRKSPELLVVMDSEKFNDWQQLDDSYLNGWSVSFPSSKQSVVENSAMILQRFTDGWKIVASHTSIVEM